MKADTLVARVAAIIRDNRADATKTERDAARVIVALVLDSNTDTLENRPKEATLDAEGFTYSPERPVCSECGGIAGCKLRGCKGPFVSEQECVARALHPASKVLVPDALWEQIKPEGKREGALRDGIATALCMLDGARDRYEDFEVAEGHPTGKPLKEIADHLEGVLMSADDVGDPGWDTEPAERDDLENLPKTRAEIQHLRDHADKLLALKRRWDVAFPTVGKRVGFCHEAEDALRELRSVFEAAARLAVPTEDLAGALRAEGRAGYDALDGDRASEPEVAE